MHVKGKLVYFFLCEECSADENPNHRLFFFCFNFSWRNSKLVCDSPSGYGNAGGFGWSFCLAGFPSVQKTSQRICALNGDTFEQEIHRRSLGCSCLTLEKRPPTQNLLLRPWQQTNPHCSSFSWRSLAQLILLWWWSQTQTMLSCSFWFAFLCNRLKLKCLRLSLPSNKGRVEDVCYLIIVPRIDLASSVFWEHKKKVGSVDLL